MPTYIIPVWTVTHIISRGHVEIDADTEAEAVQLFERGEYDEVYDQVLGDTVDVDEFQIDDARNIKCYGEEGGE